MFRRHPSVVAKPRLMGGLSTLAGFAARPGPQDVDWQGQSTRLPLGGAYRDRTDDPLLAKQVLSQLSYTPECVGGSGWIRTNDPRLIKTVL